MLHKPSTLSHVSDKQLLHDFLQPVPYFPFPQAEILSISVRRMSILKWKKWSDFHLSVVLVSSDFFEGDNSFLREHRRFTISYSVSIYIAYKMYFQNLNLELTFPLHILKAYHNFKLHILYVLIYKIHILLYNYNERVWRENNTMFNRWAVRAQ